MADDWLVWLPGQLVPSYSEGTVLELKFRDGTVCLTSVLNKINWVWNNTADDINFYRVYQDAKGKRRLPSDAGEYLIAGAEKYANHSAAYGKNFIQVGDHLMAMFPNGIKLSTKADFARFGLLYHILNKTMRYAGLFNEGGHYDSAIDGSVYFAMLSEVDELVKEGKL